jgi:hypothetical protein
MPQTIEVPKLSQEFAKGDCSFCDRKDVELTDSGECRLCRSYFRGGEAHAIGVAWRGLCWAVQEMLDNDVDRELIAKSIAEGLDEKSPYMDRASDGQHLVPWEIWRHKLWDEQMKKGAKTPDEMEDFGDLRPWEAWERATGSEA